LNKNTETYWIGQNKKLQPNQTCDVVSGRLAAGEACRDVSALGDSATGEEIGDSRAKRGKQLTCWYGATKQSQQVNQSKLGLGNRTDKVYMTLYPPNNSL